MNIKIIKFYLKQNKNIDLNHESTSLTLRNLTKNENSKYECIADNGILPSVSKKFSLTIYCKSSLGLFYICSNCFSFTKYLSKIRHQQKPLEKQLHKIWAKQFCLAA